MHLASCSLVEGSAEDTFTGQPTKSAIVQWRTPWELPIFTQRCSISWAWITSVLRMCIRADQKR